MQKVESGLKWWTGLGIRNPRAALLVGCVAIIMALATSVVTLWRDGNLKHSQMMEAKELCSEQKLQILYVAIQNQRDMNEKYETKIKELYEDINEINKTIRRR